MLNFPLPYPDELIYSTIARASVHSGIVSPKAFLDELFSDRKVIATIDLPNHLEAVEQQLPEKLELPVDKLVYAHTLFPIYAPFTTESHRKRCLDWMTSYSRGAVHLALGIAASRVKRVTNLRYCPACIQDQLSNHGEYFWVRSWQVFGADCCLDHGRLLEASVENRCHHRHQFFPATPNVCQGTDQLASKRPSKHVTKQVKILLSLSSTQSASYEQWTVYYKRLAKQADCTQGNNIRYDAIKGTVLEHWPGQWLKQYGLAISDDQACWLRSIFRKHRKSFSYLEHIVALGSFLPKQWRIDEVLEVVKNIHVSPSIAKRKLQSANLDPSTLSEKRLCWSKLVKHKGTKRARLTSGGALYAWLYRNDRDWLLFVNSKYRLGIDSRNNRVDWLARDVTVVRQLILIRNRNQRLYNSPRRSKNWYLGHLDQSATVEKNIDKLPLTAKFFRRHCEDISSYQIRRITNAISVLSLGKHKPKKWRVMRKAGLSEQRLKNSAESFLNSVVAE